MTAKYVSRVLIVDDEERARRLVRSRLDNTDDFQVVGEAANGEDALKLIGELRPDVVFLDIQMPRGTGLSVVERLDDRFPPIIVFVTAYHEFAVRAFELYAFDYLLKPFTKDRFEATLNRIRKKTGLLADASSKPTFKDFLEYFRRAGIDVDASGMGEKPDKYLRRFVVTDKPPFKMIDVDQVLKIESQDHFVRIYTADKSYLVNGKLADLEKDLDPARFIRVHRCRIVNLRAVIKVIEKGFSALELRLSNGSVAGVSRSYRDRVNIALMTRG